MEFKTIQTAKDPLFEKALQLYDAKLDISLSEDSSIFKRSLENNKTENDYAFVVGIEHDQVVSLATAHYEATTNAAFLIYLIAQDGPNHDELITLTLEEVENNLIFYPTKFMIETLILLCSKFQKNQRLLMIKLIKFLNIEDNFFMNMNLKSKKKLTTFTQITP